MTVESRRLGPPQILLMSLATACTLLLSACGGGGGGGSSALTAVPTPPPVVPQAAEKRLFALNDTGITSSQCFQEGSDVLVSCTSAAALALSLFQDGMFGRDADALTAGGSDGISGFSYTKVSASGDELPASASVWACTLDNVTGLLWEAKTTDGGLSDATGVFTNFDTSGVSQKRDGSVPTQQEINATSNAAGHVRAMNAQGLCGFKDWALPTDDELQSLVAYSDQVSAPTVDMSWFPQTRKTLYWSGTPGAGQADRAWGVDFADGVLMTDFRYVARPLRLVR